MLNIDALKSYSYITATIVLPIVAYLFYIYKRDELKKEPIGVLLLTAFLGIFLAIPVTSFENGILFEKIKPGVLVWSDCWRIGFLREAIPSEFAKFILLSLILMFNTYYDEYVDSVVYSVCVALGFVAIPNVLFLYGHFGNLWLQGIMITFIQIPAHFTFGVLMGYFFGLARLYHQPYFYFLALLVPILADGLFCSLFLWIKYALSYYFIGIILLVILGTILHNLAHHICINHMLESDIKEKASITNNITKHHV